MTTAAEMVADARTVWDFSAGVSPDPGRRVSYGYSLGASEAAEMAIHAAADGPCALVLESGFAGVAPLLEAGVSLALPETLLSSGHHDTLRKLRSSPGTRAGHAR